MIGGSFTRGGNAKKRVYAATTRDVGRLMRMFSQTIDALIPSCIESDSI
jgi:hypothetical protein